MLCMLPQNKGAHNSDNRQGARNGHMERLLQNIKRRVPGSLLKRLEAPYHFLLAMLAAAWFRFPSRRIVVIGVTGTKGKTTVVHLLHEILQRSGAKTASVSSVRFKIGEQEEPNMLKMTMPGRFFMQRFLRRAATEGCAYAVIEVTSQGIAQSRHRFIRLGCAVMTNTAPEHIESHGSFERYLRAKLDLFWRLRPDAAAVIKRDDPAARRFAAATRAHIVWYGPEGITVGAKTWSVRRVGVADNGIALEIGGMAIASSLHGAFNASNILAAAAAALACRIRTDAIADAVSGFTGVPGRMEVIRHGPFRVVVDYAHTPDSLRAVYGALRHALQATSYNPQPHLICVFGAAGGGRDRWKRPEFAKIAAEFCDEIILTNEDPYDENPDAILDDIAAGFPSDAVFHKILDRREAIHTALAAARPGDTVVITGKGAEPWLIGARGTKIPWDDRAVAREELAKL